MVSRGVPVGLDADSAMRVERSFLVVRIVRGSLLLLVLVLGLLAVELKDWPMGVSVAIALALMLQAGTLASSLRRLHAIRLLVG
jgi:hypothetical protein